ncbi:MAG TPA: sulfatase-like hydrolase/transferase [Labilithrix sp.]|nr:sulfatase-like hydrolase/transferase [Labilithrix sp.]
METARAPLARRIAAASALALIASQFAILDVLFRGSARGWLAEPRAVVDAATSIALLLVLARLATTRASRALLAVACSAVLVLQLLVFRYYHAPLDVQVLASALHASRDVRPILVRALPAIAGSIAAAAALEMALLTAFHRVLQRTDAPLAPVLAVAALGGLFGGGPRRATPEVRALHALGAVTAPREPAGSAVVSLPALHADRPELPSVLFVLTESVRAADYRGEGPLATAPETAALTRGRTDLAQLRAVSSYTALSLSAILTGLPQNGPRDAILRAPSLFDFAHAARGPRGVRPVVAYFSSQSETVFETNAVRAGVDHLATIETLRGRDVEDDADYGELPLDREIVDLFEKKLPSLETPSFVMLHFVGTHAPYFLDPARAPFQPYDHVVTWSGMPRLLNAYRDAILEQDRTLARALRAFLDHVRGRPWLVVFTSDHGEAFGENGAIHHGQNLLDEQVHVPAWIVAGDGALSPAQSSALAEHAGRFVTHLDLLPTVLDALGLWDNFAVAPYRARMPGRSLLRPYEERAPIPVTNCTGMFPCPVNTWGLYGGDRKLVARVYDNAWRCLALGGPEERLVEGPDPECARLRSISQDPFPVLPNGAPNRW